MKKAVSLILACAILASAGTMAAQISACAEQTNHSESSYSIPGDLVSDEGLLYEIDENGTITIIGSVKRTKKLVIPEEIDGRKVVSIGREAFRDYTALKELSIPDGLINIYPGAFVNCPKLSSVSIPKSVEYIGYGAFGCYAEEYFDDDTGEIYEDYTTDIDRAFVIYGYTGTAAEEYYLDNCLSEGYGICFVDVEEYIDEEYSVRYKLNDNGEYTVKGLFFYGDHLPDNDIVIRGEIDGHKVTSIDECAFEGIWMRSVTIPGEIKTIGKGAFSLCYLLNKVVLEEGTEEIQESAFRNCDSLFYIVMPKSVKKIDDDAFAMYDRIVGMGEDEHVVHVYEDFTLYGYEGTEGERFANAHNEIEFKPVPSSGKIGDVDIDGVITSADSLMILRESVELGSMTDWGMTLADIDGDKEITSADALAVLRYSVGLGSGTEFDREVDF